MVTLDAKNKVLFSGDAFGCFGALNGGIIDTEINCETFWLEMVRYYSNIVGKFVERAVLLRVQCLQQRGGRVTPEIARQLEIGRAHV